MGFTKKTWVDRLTEYPTRRTLTKEDGTSEIVTVARNEGAVSKEGDAFSAANMNNLETRISSAFSSTDTEIASLKKSVSDGKTTVANAITNQGVSTATDAAFATMATNIATVATNKYNAGITAADARVNTNSASYKSGYSAGQSAAKKTIGVELVYGDWNDDCNCQDTIVKLYVNGSVVKQLTVHNNQNGKTWGETRFGSY